MKDYKGYKVYDGVVLSSGTSTLSAGEAALNWKVTGYGSQILESGSIVDGTWIGRDSSSDGVR